jgi:DNA-binding MltR family transcriptional regulator
MATSRTDLRSQIIQRMADAAYKATVKEAREDVSKIDFETRLLVSLFLRLKDESETAQILIFSFYLEHSVRLLLKSRLHHLDSAKEDEAIFGSNGPLNTFGNRISLSYQLGWISPQQKKKLDSFRKVRNEFAHRAFKVKLSDNNIAELFKVIDYNLHETLKPMRESIVTVTSMSDPLLPDDAITQEQEFLCNLALLAEKTFTELLVIPTAIAFRVHPKDVAGTHEEGPRVVNDLHHALAETLFNLLVRPDAFEQFE